VTRAVIDTNQMLRMAAAEERSPLFMAWRAHEFELVMSGETLAELEAVIARPRTHRFLPPVRGERFITLVRGKATFLTPAARFPRCRDPKDDVVIATAVAARPCYLVTADRDLYDDVDLATALRALEVTVVQAGEFLAALPD
jgi:putative PIN family toxin of toxin-antitoxin system